MRPARRRTSALDRSRATRSLTAESLQAACRKEARSDQTGAARSARHRRTRQHLCGGSALERAHRADTPASSLSTRQLSALLSALASRLTAIRRATARTIHGRLDGAARGYRPGKGSPAGDAGRRLKDRRDLEASRVSNGALSAGSRARRHSRRAEARARSRLGRPAASRGGVDQRQHRRGLQPFYARRSAPILRLRTWFTS